jgi:hypothetical protein
MAVSALALLCACEPSAPKVESDHPVRWHRADPTQFTRDVIAVNAAALRGDPTAVEANLHRAHDNVRRSLKLPDPSRPIDPELARVAAKRVDGVRSVVWLDRENMLVIVSRNEQKSQSTIDAICLQLDPLGDTLAVVVNLQSGAATTGDELEILSRNCQLAPGDRALLQEYRRVDALSPAYRAQQQANNTP